MLVTYKNPKYNEQKERIWDKLELSAQPFHINLSDLEKYSDDNLANDIVSFQKLFVENVLKLFHFATLFKPMNQINIFAQC